MDAHGVIDLLGAWALDVCDDAERSAVEAHLAQCPACAAEASRLRSAVGWLGVVDQVTTPPAGLRRSTLDAARRRRQPAVMRTLIEAYAGQVVLLDRALATLGPDDWRRPDPRHRDVAGLITHLAANDAALATELGLSVAHNATARDTWRANAGILLNGLDERADPARRVTLAARDGRVPGSLSDALVQRAFETWIHRDDLAELAGRPVTDPPPEQVRRIAGLAMRVLPGALRAHGLAGAEESAFELSGPAGGRWTFPLNARLTISLDAVEFARLAANRRRSQTLRFEVDGDPAIAHRVLHVVSLLGCD